MATVSTMNADQLLDWIQASPLQPLTIDEIATAHSETSLAALQELLETLIGDGRLYSFEFSTPESSKQPQAVRVYWTLSFLEAPASPPPPPPPPAVSTPTSPTTSPVLLKNVSSATPSPNRTLGAKPSGVAPRMGLQRKRPRESASPRANANDDLVSPSKRPCSTGPSSPPSPQSPTGGVTAASPSSPSSPPSPAGSGTLEEQIRSLEQQIAQKKHQLHSARAATARSLSLTAEDKRIDELIEKWTLVCQAAAQDLYDAMRARGSNSFRTSDDSSEDAITMLKVLQHINIDPRTIRYNADTEEFE